MSQPKSHAAYERFALFALIGLALVLRLWRLSVNEFWFDEAASSIIAARSLPDIVNYVLQSVGEHPPLYYMLLHGWQQLLGFGEYEQRILSVIFSVLFVAMMYAVGKRLYGWRFGLLTGFVAAIQPFVVYQAQENRMYSAVLFLSALVFWLLLLPSTKRAWSYLLLIIISILGVFTHYFFLTLPLAVVLFLLKTRSRELMRMVPPFVILLVACGGALAWLLNQPGPLATIESIAKNPVSLPQLLTTIEIICSSLAGDLGASPPEHIFITLTTWVLVLIGLWQAPKNFPLWPFLVGILPLLLVLPWGAGRYGSTFVPAMVLAISIALQRIRQMNRAYSYLAFLIFLIASGIALNNIYTFDKGHFGDALLSIQDNFDPASDVIVLVEPDSWVLMEYYGAQLPQPLDILYLPSDNKVDVVDRELIQKNLAPLLGDRKRIILGPVAPRNRDPNSLVEKFLLTESFSTGRRYWPTGELITEFVTPRLLESGPSRLTFLNQVELLRSELSSSVVAPGEEVVARLEWNALQGNLPEMAVSMQLLDSSGKLWALQQESPCNGWCPTTEWIPDSIVTDNRALLIPVDMPPGEYALMLSLVNLENGEEDSQELTRVNIGLDPVRLQSRLGDAPTLTQQGVEIWKPEVGLPEVVRAGNTIGTSVDWWPQLTAPTNWSVVWSLQDEAKEVVQSWERSPSIENFPPILWGKERYVRGQSELTLDGGLAAGAYRLLMTVVDDQGNELGDPLDLGKITVEERSRSFEMPLDATATEGVWQSGLRLYTQPLSTTVVSGTSVVVPLVWQAKNPLDDSYKVFVHLLDADDKIVAQDDRYPSDGSAPTSSWIENEVMLDPHSLELPLNLPSGSYNLVVGFYDPITNQRLALENGDNRFKLTTLTVNAPQ